MLSKDPWYDRVFKARSFNRNAFILQCYNLCLLLVLVYFLGTYPII